MWWMKMPRLSIRLHRLGIAIVLKSYRLGIHDTQREKNAPCITDCYDLCGKRLEGKQRGPVIVRYNDGSTRKVMVK